MQVFVEEVGLWMDSMDSMKHVSVLLDALLRESGCRLLVVVHPHSPVSRSGTTDASECVYGLWGATSFSS